MNSYFVWIHTYHVSSYIVWIHTYHVISYIERIHTLQVNSYIVWIHTLLAQFPTSGCNYLSLSLEQRRWQKQYHSCPGDGNVGHHHPRSTNTRVWGLCLACVHVVQHDGFCSSCCLSKSKNKSKSTKEIWNEIDFVFWMNCRCLAKRTDHCAWPCCSFSWSDCACDHPSCCRTCKTLLNLSLKLGSNVALLHSFEFSSSSLLILFISAHPMRYYFSLSSSCIDLLVYSVL